MSHVLSDGNKFTVCTELGDHRFETDVTRTGKNTRATIYYEETHIDGSFEVLPDGPIEDVWTELIESDEFTRHLLQEDVDVIRRG